MATLADEIRALLLMTESVALVGERRATVEVSVLGIAKGHLSEP